MTFGTAVAAFVVLLLAVCQPTPGRRAVALRYAALNLGHLFGLSWWLDDTHWYFVTAAAADILIVGLILQLPRLTPIGVPLIRVCLAEVLIHTVWWALWWHGDGYDPAAYNTVYQGLQMWLMWVLIRKDRADDMGRYRVDRWGDFIRVVIGARPTHVSGRGAP